MGGMIGFIAAGLYTTFQFGFGFHLVENYDWLAFWNESPLVLGYTSDGFRIGSVIFLAITALFMLMPLQRVARKVPQVHGTAAWADLKDMARKGYFMRYDKITGPVFGKAVAPGRTGNYLTAGDMPHSLVVAPTRAGKGVGVVIPTLLTFDGSILALDVKGELFEETSRARIARGDRVFRFSPLDVSGRTHCYNPVLDIARAPRERQFVEARRLATNLIVAKGESAQGFVDGARDLLVAGLLYCIEKGNPTIGAVYDLFATPGEKYKLFAYLAKQTNVPEAKRIFNNMAGNDTKIITSYTSVLGDGGLNLWADSLIKTATSKSDFSVYDLRRDPATIYICVSPNDLEVISPLIRLMFQQLVSILQRTMPQKDETFEVLFLLDEFKHLGKMEAVETAITTIAGYKGRFMFIIQSLSALTAGYENHGKENFLSNTGVQVFMATADQETPEYIAKAIGEFTHYQVTKNWGRLDFLDSSYQASAQGAQLIRPEQIRLLDEDKEIVLIKGQPPLQIPKIKYYADRILKKLHADQTGPLPEPPVQVFDPGIEVSPVPMNVQPPAGADAEAEAGSETATAPAPKPSGSAGPARGSSHGTDAAEAAPKRESAHEHEAPATERNDQQTEIERQRALLERIIALQETGTARRSSVSR